MARHVARVGAMRKEYKILVGKPEEKKPFRRPRARPLEMSTNLLLLRGCIQKLPDWVDNEIYAYNNKHLLGSNTKVMAAKLTRLTHKIAIQLRLVAENCTICSSRSRWPVRKLLDKIAVQLRLVAGSCTICSSCSRWPVRKLLDTSSYISYEKDLNAPL
jgi:hypothetical protein